MELSGFTSGCEDFLRQWNDGTDCICAQTSGSTGIPKKIHLNKSDMMKSAAATNSFLGIGRDSLLHLPLSTDYIAGKMMVVRGLMAGCTVMAERPSNHPLQDYSGRRISLSAVVPSQVPGLLEGSGWRFVDNLIIGGAPISPDSEDMILQSGINAYATYGMTESCSHVALRRLGCDFFTALPGIHFSLDERGCLVIRATGFSFGRLVTNDIVELAGEDSFRWLGRYDNAINTGGLKVIPEQMEKSIAPLMGRHEFYITSRASRKWGEEIVLMVEGDECNVTRDDLRHILGPELCPKEIVLVECFERTSSSKIIRRKF